MALPLLAGADPSQYDLFPLFWGRPAKVAPLHIAIITPVWGRLAVTHLYWMAVERLREQWAPHYVQAYIAGSEPVHEVLTAAHRAVWVHQPNVLTDKFNAATYTAYLAGADYFLIMGSDDILTPALADLYRMEMEAGTPFFGMLKVLCMEPASQRAFSVGHSAMHRQQETVGAGRVLSRKLVRRVRGRPWPGGRARSADGHMMDRLRRAQIRAPKVKFDGTPPACVLDIKTGANMWSMDYLAQFSQSSKPTDYHALLACLPPEESYAIQQLALDRNTASG